MELPQYDQYSRWFGEGPLAVHYGMDQMDLAKQFQAQKLEQEVQTAKQKQLANLFDEQNNPIRLRQNALNADTTEAQLGPLQTKSWIDSQTKEQQLRAQMSELAFKATKADLDGMEVAAQQMAYSPDPKVRAQGEQLLKMHKDFIKLREEQKFNADESAKQRAHQTALENQRNANALGRQQALAKAKLDAKAGTEKMTTDQLRAHYIRKAQEARAAGDDVLANEFYAEAEYLTNLRASERPDTQAGQPDIGAITNLPTRAERAAPQRPSSASTGKVQNAPASLADVQKMYPGVPADKLREAYKRKFGVDLK